MLILRLKSARLLWGLQRECCARSLGQEFPTSFTALPTPLPQPGVFIIPRLKRALANGDESRVLIRELETGVVSVTEIGTKDGQLGIVLAGRAEGQVM